MKKRFVASMTAFMTAIIMLGQTPQFSHTDYADWIYNNPSIELNQDNILGNRIVLYTNSEGFPLTLTSPPFACHAGETIDLTVTWVTRFYQSDGFVMSKAGFTAALINLDGVAIDSVTFTPTTLKRENEVKLSFTVSHGLSNARLRFASWKGDVMSSGAVRKIVISAVLRADVNLDGEVSLADVNTVVDAIISGTDDSDLMLRADVNGDGEVSLADINSVIDAIIS